jgi:hypothetical protein
VTTDTQNSSGVLAKLAAFSLALAIIPISAYFGTQMYLAPGAKCVNGYLWFPDVLSQEIRYTLPQLQLSLQTLFFSVTS